MKAGKIWGQTELIHANGVLEFHRIEYKKDVACSKHKHEFKWNGFFVESGKMKVLVCVIVHLRLRLRVLWKRGRKRRNKNEKKRKTNEQLK